MKSAVLLAAAGLALASPALAAEAEPPACAAALEIVRATLDKSPDKVWHVAGIVRPPEQAPKPEAWREDAPSADLVERYVSAPADDVLDVCASLRAFLDARRVAHGTAAAHRMFDEYLMDTTRQPPVAFPPYPAQVLSLSLPVLSADGDEALATTNLVASARVGFGFVTHLRRDADGRWHVIESQTSWIS